MIDASTICLSSSCTPTVADWECSKADIVERHCISSMQMAGHQAGGVSVWIIDDPIYCMLISSPGVLCALGSTTQQVNGMSSTHNNRGVAP